MWAMYKEGTGLVDGSQKDLIPLQRMWIQLMKDKEAEQKKKEMEQSGSGRSPNPNRQPGGGGSGVGGETTHYINDGMSNDENPNAHLKEELDIE